MKGEDPSKEQLCTGALFDFLGYLTTQETSVTLSAYHDVTPILKHLENFALLRKISLRGACVCKWSEKVIQDTCVGTRRFMQGCLVGFLFCFLLYYFIQI